MGSIFLNFGEMGLRDQNNGKKIGINWSRIYHVTTDILKRALYISTKARDIKKNTLSISQ